MSAERKWSPTIAVRALGLATLIAMGLFPPWQVTYTPSDGAEITDDAGYAWAFRAPVDKVSNAGGQLHINMPRIVAQLVATFLVITVAVYNPSRQKLMQHGRATLLKGSSSTPTKRPNRKPVAHPSRVILSAREESRNEKSPGEPRLFTCVQNDCSKIDC